MCSEFWAIRIIATWNVDESTVKWRNIEAAGADDSYQNEPVLRKNNSILFFRKSLSENAETSGVRAAAAGRTSDESCREISELASRAVPFSKPPK